MKIQPPRRVVHRLGGTGPAVSVPYSGDQAGEPRENSMKATYLVDRLRRDHAELEEALRRELARPKPRMEIVHDLKRRKLRIKDELQMALAA